MIYAVLLIAALLRFIGINQSLWLDEAISANVAKMPIEQIVKNFSISDFHPPFYYWFLNIWTKIFGSNVVMLRLSSVIFSLITIYFVYLIGKKIKGEKTGIWAAIFLAVNPLFVYFSQELRMYAMVAMWLTIGFYYWIKIYSNREKIDTKDLVIFNLMMFLSFACFYGSVFLIAALIIYWLIIKENKLFWKSSIGIGAAILILSPLLFIQIKNSQEMLSQVSNWSLVLGRINLKNLMLIPLKFGVGKISWLPKIWYYLVAGGWSLIILGLIIKNKKKSNGLKIFLWLPIVLAIIFSIKSPMLQYFRFLYLLPIMVLILAINADKKWQKKMVAGGFLLFSLVYLFNSNYHREDWKSVAKEIKGKERVYMIASFGDPIKFYDPEIRVVDIRSSEKELNMTVIPYGEIIHGVDHTKILADLGFKKTGQKNFREIVVEEWKKY